jgi:hypothetical protein
MQAHGFDMQPHRFLAFTRQYVDPSTMLAEVLFGLITTLTFTLGAGLTLDEQGRRGARELLIALIGCNIAWGIIDAMLYLLAEVFDRGRLGRVHYAVRRTKDEEAATHLVASELDDLLCEVTQPEERAALYRRIVSNMRSRPGSVNRIRKADVLGSLASFACVFCASLPAAIPFLLIDRARLALRVSNAILLALLFVIGYFFARTTMGRPWLAGMVMLGGGLILVAMAIALGG